MTQSTKLSMKSELGRASMPQLSSYSEHMDIPCARPRSECFTCINSFTLHNNPVKHHLYSHLNDTEMLCNLTKLSFPVSHRTGIWMWAVWLQSPYPLHYISLCYIYIYIYYLWEYDNWPYLVILLPLLPGSLKIGAKVIIKNSGIITRIFPIINFDMLQFFS